MKPARQALIGAGANLGDRVAALQQAALRLRATECILSLDASSVYETEPVGVVDQPRFLNAVFGVETTLTPEALLDVLLGVEQQLGRVRIVRWGPRTLDLDLLAFENEMRSTASLTLPHPRMLEREFVTVPLRELLARERFSTKAWQPLRAQLAGLPPASGAVRRCDEVSVR